MKILKMWCVTEKTVAEAIDIAIKKYTANGIKILELRFPKSELPDIARPGFDIVAGKFIPKNHFQILGEYRKEAGSILTEAAIALGGVMGAALYLLILFWLIFGS